MPPRTDSLKTLSTIAKIIQKSKPSENPLAHIVLVVREQMNVDVCSLYILEPQGKHLVLVATDGLDPAAVGKVRMSVSEGLTGLAVEKLQPVVVKNASQHPRYKYFPETGEEQFNTFAAVPLMEGGRVIGVLTIQTVAGRDLSPDDIDLLNLFAFQLAGVVRNLVSLEEVLKGVRRAEKPAAQLRGIPVAPGFGIGTAFYLIPGTQPLILPVRAEQTLNLKDEWKKLAQAVRKASAGLLRLEKRLQKKFSKAESDIFYSHRMILSDKSFLKKLKGEVENGGSAIDAVQAVIGGYIQELEKMEDPHFRERAADLQDIQQRVLEQLVGRAPRSSKKVLGRGVLLAETLVPSDTARLDPDSVQAILTERGGVTSHAAIIARSLGIPAVMGIPNLASRIRSGDLVIVDGNVGYVYVNPEPAVLREYERVQEKYADRIVTLRQASGEKGATRDGHPVLVEANIGIFSGLTKLKQFGAEGVGLYRTEFPFMVRKKLLGEDEQYDLYRKIIEEVEGIPVTFRLLDAGGDKPLEALGLGVQTEANPFLGYRSIRLSLSRPEILTVQLKALLRASALGPIRILIPMISGVEEIRAVRRIFNEIRSDFDAGGQAYDRKIPIGLLVEVPSAVWMAHLLIRDCDFFSIGTNDLIQYTLAVDRNNEQVAQFFEPLHPAVLNAIGTVARVGLAAQKRVSVCGEIAGDPFMTPLLVGLGVSGLSMIPSSIPAVKAALRVTDYPRVKTLADQCLQAATTEEVKTLLEPFRKEIEQVL
ncbi:MAG TPA: phosphoenolpyruvate--protein phosphotransferase [bacterium]|nr:phosphoenolpyruvate--protein phosphotransferase [bacterium]